MPANLSPDYLAAEQEFKSAETHSEKIAALEKMLSTIPKHKGTEKLQADIKRRLSRARKESRKKGGARQAPPWLIKKEGAGQVVLLGPPNSGKSSLVTKLTHARPEVAGYPFTTRLPTPGMMTFENVQIQLLDLPPVSAEFTERWLPQVVRAASAGVLLVDSAAGAVLEETEFVLQFLEDRRLPVPELLVGNKADLPGARQNLSALAELFGDRFRYLAVSAETGETLDAFARQVFESLHIVRVYSKPPGKPVELTKPYLLKRGQTVQEAARLVHNEFARHLRFTRLYRVDSGHSGLMVDRTHVVEDEDILEFHI